MTQSGGEESLIQANYTLRFQAVLQSVLQKGCPVGYRIKTIKIFSTANNKYFLRRF
jgi:hypothetical protein